MSEPVNLVNQNVDPLLRNVLDVRGRQVKAMPMTSGLFDYLIEQAFTPHPLLPKIQQRALSFEKSYMMTTEDQAALLNFLVKMIGARCVLEVGCYLGYSAIAMAAALPEDGRLITLDKRPEWIFAARKHFVEAGLADVIELREGWALESMVGIASEFGEQAFDMVFIDADKIHTPHYFAAAIPLLRPGGLVVVDNVLWRGEIHHDSEQCERVNALRTTNRMAREHPDLETFVLPASDGMLIGRKM